MNEKSLVDELVSVLNEDANPEKTKEINTEFKKRTVAYLLDHANVKRNGTLYINFTVDSVQDLRKRLQKRNHTVRHTFKKLKQRQEEARMSEAPKPTWTEKLLLKLYYYLKKRLNHHLNDYYWTYWSHE